MVKLCIFDMDGLLIDSERIMWIPNEKIVLKQMGYEVDEDFLFSLMGGSKITNTKNYHDKFGLDFNVDEFYRLVEQRNQIQIDNNGVPLRDGALEILDYIKKAKIDYCIGSSSSREYIKQILNNNNMLEDFKTIVCRDDVKFPKPNPDIYLKCMSLYNYDPLEVLVLEDAHNGALAAHSAGCRCIIVKDLARLTAWDYENCEAVVDNLKEVIDIIKKENETTTSV